MRSWLVKLTVVSVLLTAVTSSPTKLLSKEGTPTSSPNLRLFGPELASLMTLGTAVVRGRDWNWDNQDGGMGKKGKVINGLKDGWVRVQWDESGDFNFYRMGHNDKYDLNLATLQPVTTATGEEETSARSPRPRLSGPELAALMTVGAAVVRGKDWKWDNQDGGIGKKGKIIGALIDGWVRVQWDESQESNSYRMGNEDKYDLDLATLPPVTIKISKGTPASSPKPQLSGQELAALMTVGAIVVRGRDWKWDNQDGGSGKKGKVISGPIDGWVRVQWDDSGETNSYRMGNEDKYDLDLATLPPATATTGNEETLTSTPKPRFSGPELAALMTVGTTVVRGRDWKWDNQDGGSGKKGKVISRLIDGWVRVQWDDSGESNSYRMGNEDKYDLDLATLPPVTATTGKVENSTLDKTATSVEEETETIPEDETRNPSQEESVTHTQKETATNSQDDSILLVSTGPKVLFSGPELAALMKVGTRVIRGKDWNWGNQDGGLGHEGCITETNRVTGWFVVEWDTGCTHSYRMGHDDKYDLQLAWSETETYTNLKVITTESRMEAKNTKSSSTICSPTHRTVFVDKNIQEGNELFGKLVEKEIAGVPRTNRIQTMQDILEIFKRFSKFD